MKRSRKAHDEWKKRSRKNAAEKRKRKRQKKPKKAPARARARARKAKRYELQFGDHAEWIRGQPCHTCGAPPRSDPSHAKTRGAGGSRKHLFPQCRRCHRLFEAGKLIVNGARFTKAMALAVAAQYWASSPHGDGDYGLLR